jgi:hypothetical protein
MGADKPALERLAHGEKQTPAIGDPQGVPGAALEMAQGCAQYTRDTDFEHKARDTSWSQPTVGAAITILIQTLAATAYAAHSEYLAAVNC